MTDPTPRDADPSDEGATDVLRAWLDRYDANDKAAAHGRPFMWDDDGNVTATSHNFDNVIPPMDVDEVEAVRAVLAGRDRLAARVAEMWADVGLIESEWDEPRTEWTWGVRKPDGAAHLPEHMERGRSEDEVRREFEKVVDNMGYRKALLRRAIGPWRDADFSQ